MGSPISPILADLVMEEFEETAISTFPHPPKWWFRYVDDSHSCLRKDQVDQFHKHLNSIDPNIHFGTRKHPWARLTFSRHHY